MNRPGWILEKNVAKKEKSRCEEINTAALGKRDRSWKKGRAETPGRAIEKILMHPLCLPSPYMAAGQQP